MSARIDRLIKLLHAGSNDYVRTNAAEHIVQLTQADTSLAVMNKILALMLQNVPVWTTRVSCATALALLYLKFGAAAEQLEDAEIPSKE